MAVLRKQSFSENLETFSVLVNDTAENSAYFKITDLPDTFTGGKNSFLIQGSQELVQDTVVKVEIKDSNGNIIYTEAGEGIPEYYEGTSKPVAVYVYPDTAYGPCTITILGELAEYINERGVKTGVPVEWRNKYNVRWQKIVNVNPNLTNSSKIRFYRRPKVNITETVLPVYNRSVVRTTISGSVNGQAVQPLAGSNFRTFKGDTIYYLYTTSSIFSSSMEGENITITGLGQSYETTIKDVVNSTKLLVNIPYYETSSTLPTSYQLVKNFESGSFTLSYDNAISLSNSTINASYAKIRLTDLEAFSGDPARLKVFSKRKADIGNFSLIEDIRLESSEILIADDYSGSINVSKGQFKQQSIIDDFWKYTDINGNIYPAIQDNVVLASSVKLIDDNTKNSSEYPQRIFYYNTDVEFSKNTEYEIDFLPILSSSLHTPTKLVVYGSGSAFVNDDIVTSLGKKIKEIEFDGTFRRYDRQQIIFKSDKDGVGKIVFAIYQGNWQISNISLRASSETNFSPNEITLNVEVPTVVKNDEYEFRFEFYDVNNNYVPVNVVTSSVFTGGSTLEDVATSAARFLQVSPNSNVFPFGYNNNYDFQEVNTFASVPIGAASIVFNIQATGLTGSITFTSAAFDSGGVYINPATYVGQYPGFLTNITTSSAILDVANFTGSMASTIEVKRIEYTASCEDLRDVVSIFKVVEGTPGSDGENGEQYIIKPVNGTAIKNSNPNTGLEVQLVKISGNSAVDINSGNVKLVTGSLTIVEEGNGVVAGANGVNYNAIFYAEKINGLLEIKAYDFTNGRIVDTISLADVTDGLTTGFIDASNGLILTRNPKTNLYTPTETALTASFYDSKGVQYSASLNVIPNYTTQDRLKYIQGYSHPSISLDFVKTTSGQSVNNNTYIDTTGLNFKYTFTEPYTRDTISIGEGVIINKDGTDGENQAIVKITPELQFVVKNTSGTYSSVSPFLVQVFETGSALSYTTTQPPNTNGTFTIYLTSGQGTNQSVNGAKSGSILPPTVTTINGSSSSFAVQYKSSKGTLSELQSGSHLVNVVSDGGAGKIVQIVLEPNSQVVTRDTGGNYNAPAPFIVRAYEDGVPLTYSTSEPLSNGRFIISITPSEGTNNSVNGALSGSITPAVLSAPMFSASTDFAVKYKTTDGVTQSGLISQSHTIGVALEGQTGPGVVFTGVWETNRFYQFGSGSTARRDVVLWSRTGLEPYDTYYATLKQHLSDTSITSTGNGAPNYSTGSVGSAWQELGQEDYFVAAKIAIFEESFVKNTINVGSSNNGGVSSANITIFGSGSYPYMSMGQSSVVGSQGYAAGNGIFIGRDKADGVFKASFETSSSANYLRWSGTTLDINGSINITGGNAATNQSLSGSLTTLSLSASNAAASASISGSDALLAARNAAASASLSGSVNPASQRIVKNATPSGTGLYLGSDNLGYYDSGIWKTYMSSSGNFYLTSSVSNGGYLEWNAGTATLLIAGAINIKPGGNAATTTDASNAVTSGSLYAANAAASASVSGSDALLAARNAAASASLSGSVNPASQRIVKNATPSGTGLYLGSDNLGYYDAGVWKTYMSSSGNFYLTSSIADGGYLEWNANTATLLIAGAINIKPGGNAATTTDTSNAVTSGSLYASNAVNSGSLYASNAAASASVSGSDALLAARNAAASASLSGSVNPTSQRIVKNATPSGTGLYLGSDNLGYYDAGVWKTYMSSSGNFYLTSSISNGGYLEWNAGTATLLIAGAINIKPGGNAATTTDASNAVTSGSLYASNAVNSGSLYASNAAASASVSGSDALLAARNAAASASLSGSVNPSSQQIVKNATPSGTGLYLGSNNLGYYDSGVWKTYMSSSGNFYLTSSISNGGYLEWNAGTATLLIAGAINIKPGGNAATTTDTSNAVNSGSLYATNAVNSGSLYASNAAASASVSGSNALTAAANAAASASLSGSVNPLSQQIVKAATPSGAGLYLGSNYLGYYDGGNWGTYMSSSGDFYLSGSAGNYLEWNSQQGTLNIDGTINATEGNIGGWNIQTTKLVSTNTSMSFNSADSSIRIGSGSGDATTIVIRSGELSARSANTETISSLPEISTNAPATGSSIANTYSSTQTLGPIYGNAKSITILSTEEGSYTANLTCSGLDNSGTPNNILATKNNFAGSFSLSLSVQVSRFPNFSSVIYETGLGSGNFYGSGSSTDVTFSYNSTTPINVNLVAGEYFVRLKWYGSINRSGGNITINSRTSITSDTLNFSQNVAQTEIADGGFQAVRNVNKYVTINRVGTTDVMLTVGGDITATGNITAYSASDKRLKKNIIPIQFSLQKISKIDGVEFDWNDDYMEMKGGEDGYFVKKHDVGVIAQQIEEILPEVVATRYDGYKAVRYEKIVPLLIQAIKELKKEIDILKYK